MKQKPTPVVFTGDERIDLHDCYVFRDGLAHQAQLSIASAVSYTDHPHLFHISIAVPGSKKMTLNVGIPFQEAMKLTRYAMLWNECVDEYDECRMEMVRSLFEEHVPDLTAIPWSESDVAAVRDMETNDEYQEAIKSDLLRIAEASLEGVKHE